MHLSESRKSNRLPTRFPVGTTYVVEGSAGEEGHLRVFSRYVVLPGGQRINLADDFGGPALSRTHGCRTRDQAENAAQSPRKDRSGRVKKIMARGGTTRQHRR
jgi:hypothetical protein